MKKTLLGIRYGFFLILFFMVFSQSYAQSVGLVLSGGGSKGAAHIGVIKALEENHIPIDYIAGTSIGAIIGGLYASGWSVEEMEAFFLDPNFQKMADGIIDDKYVYYSTVDRPNSSWFNVKFDLDYPITSVIPTNLISPDRIDFTFMELFASTDVVSGNNFDSLFVPFRCVAADIGSNRAVVLNKGNLGKSIRASMTFPFYFNPVVIDSMILFDGGMYNNFPSDVMLEGFFPDIIIGSKVASNFKPPKEGNIVSQLENIFMHNTDYSVYCDNSVLIEPTIDRISLLDFSRTKELIDIGYQETLKKIVEIRMFVTDSVHPDEVDRRREAFNKQKPHYIFDSISVSNLKPNQARYVRKQLKQDEDKIDMEMLKKEYYKLLSDGKIASISPHTSYNQESGTYNLDLDVELDKKFQFDFGGNITSTAKNHVYLGLTYKYLASFGADIKMNTHIGRFYNSGNMEVDLSFPAKIPISVKLGYQYNNFNYFNSATYFIDNETPIYLLQTESFSYLNAAVPTNNVGKMGLYFAKGFTRSDYYQTNNFISTDTTDRTYYYVNNINLYFDRKTLNRKQFPNKGTHLYMHLAYYGGKERYFPGNTSNIINELSNEVSYFQFKLYYENYFKKIGKRTRLGFKGELLLSNQELFTNYTSTLLNSPTFYPNPESRTLFLTKFRAHNYAAGGLIGVLSFTKNIDLRLESYVFVPYQEIIRDYYFWPSYEEAFISRFYSGSASIVYYNPIAPVHFSVSYYENYEHPFSFMFGIGYSIFNKRLVD
jgi:NTE family protein